MSPANQPWYEANLVVVDLEGSGAQERENEQILEIAAIRLVHRQPDMATAYTTCIDPGRPIPSKPWISPGLSGTTLHGQPALTDIVPELTGRLSGTHLVGHNVGVDWRLLHRQLPYLRVAGLVDTHRLAKAVGGPVKLGLTDLLSYYQLTDAVAAAAPGSRPHRALWDTTGAALLLIALIRRHWNADPTLQQLLDAASSPTQSVTLQPPDSQTRPAAQGTLFD